MIVPKGKLIIIGGAVDMGSNVTLQEHILQPDYIKFFEQGILRRIINESAKHEGSQIEVITTASQIPELVGAEYIKAFGQLNVTNVNVLHIKSREDAGNKAYLDRIRKADVVMFSGGDQLRLTAIFGGTEFLQILKQRYQKENFVIAGTSAGAAAASTHMIYRGQSNEALVKGEVQITAGLGFIDSVIVDTHFVQRGRIGRLMYAVATNPGILGIGLGEDTGLLITEGYMMEAIGSGLIILVDGRNIVSTNIYDVELGSPISIENLRVHVMSIFDKYDLVQHRLIIKKSVKVEEGVFINAPGSKLLQ
ncbi:MULTISPECIES: cyanophycinase [Mucilaginibacter]|uniref:Cyanophycinase n=1 Tax=Mucilaginibacter rubeus TaxID=2027860 RepID=A0AAE6JI35_9SPHI|nr:MULTISPECIES: cyanophycinase [Mucilaginibacter]QEM06089.1 cyanophycinase [Mucilaginibacter rubeus]QEM18669.1 cyanophycinase [Mucilaginibacter gossypii]QTE44788.1 cyanophycinase [Mucilaginibacter rubeus]QTE51386.1 cyanophycinase [Mucilaginibacter rubeus]QTE56473.1 cyanophycinase [Mucilaginibacter rubeus]